jgi:hypothetical protein
LNGNDRRQHVEVAVAAHKVFHKKQLSAFSRQPSVVLFTASCNANRAPGRLR